MDRFLLMGYGRVWDNELHCFSTEWRSAKSLSWGMENIYIGIDFPNGHVDYYNGYMVSIGDKCFDISLPTDILTIGAGITINGAEYQMGINEFDIVSSIFKSGWSCWYNFYCGIPSYKMQLYHNGVVLYESYVCLFEMWALILNDDFSIDAAVIYNGAVTGRLSIDKVFFSVSGRIYKAMTFAGVIR